MDNKYELKIIPEAIEKGGIAKIRVHDKSDDYSATKKFLVFVDDQQQTIEPKTVTYTGLKEYLWDLDTSNLNKGGYTISIQLSTTPASPVDTIDISIGPNITAEAASTSSENLISLEASKALVLVGELNVYEALDGIYRATNRIADKKEIGLARSTRERTSDLSLWISILQSTKAMSFENYETFMDIVFCGKMLDGRLETRELESLNHTRNRRFLPFTDTDSYRSLKAATEAFVMANCGVALNNLAFDEAEIERVIKTERGFNLASAPPTFQDTWNDYLKAINGEKTIPYLYLVRDKLKDIPLKKHTLDQMLDFTISQDPNLAKIDEKTCFGILSEKLTMPCFLELIWSYWHEESMMVQGMNAISRRFQNVRNPRGNDPLAGIEINPLQPLNNLLWGYVQDEQHRLSVVRRAYEYDHHYGISLQGKAIKDFSPADSRSRFLEAFHQLLHLCSQYYKQEDDLTVKADAFPIRNALREVHLILSEGAHNQYGDLPSTARIEMLMQQYILARPEFRQVLPTRIMVAYPEPWMDRVNAINNLMGWTKSSPIHFANLGIFGEQLLLSIRFGSWSITDTSAEQAAVWANFWRQAVQEYIHAYHSVTGVELGATRVNNERIDSRPPSYHLSQRANASLNGSSNSNGQVKVTSNGKSKVGY